MILFVRNIAHGMGTIRLPDQRITDPFLPRLSSNSTAQIFLAEKRENAPRGTNGRAHRPSDFDFRRRTKRSNSI